MESYSLWNVFRSTIDWNRAKPRYVLMELAQTEEEQLADNDDLLEISRRLIDRNRKAYEVLAK